MQEFLKTLYRKQKSELSILFELLDYLRNLTWNSEIWKSKPALIDKNGGTLRPYIGQKFDNNSFELIKDGWTHEHCEICIERIENNQNAYESQNEDWVCENCYDFFIKVENIEKIIETLELK
ncbi:MAG: hypothetical protein A3G95_02760 [Flavobacteria bacterium RIFCSPLOWO2_12_FULL_31_7]|nr:MAG: hypothetical protein A3G95_02760 [Flavobacteria bacterium RIFCSPLOWO2_12_FULL_31_7]